MPPIIHRRPARSLLLLWILLIPTSVLGQIAISGSVTEHALGSPVANASVQVVRGIHVLAQTVSAEDGRYTLSHPYVPAPAESFQVSVRADGYLEAHQAFEATQPKVRLDFSLERAPSISGRIRLPNGSAAAGMQVVASRFVADAWFSSNTVTQEDGRYVIDNLDLGSYRICAGGIGTGMLMQCFDHRDQASFSSDPAFTPVDLGAGDERTGVDFDLAHGSAVSGRMLDARTGHPFGGRAARLIFFDVEGRLLDRADVTTDAEGSYRASGLPAGEFYLAVEFNGPFREARLVYPDLPCPGWNCDPTQGQRLTAPVSGELTQIDFAFHPDAIVRGKVVDAQRGTGIGSATVNGYAPQTGPFGTTYHVAWSTLSQTDGTYELYLRGTDQGARYYVTSERAAPHINSVHPDIVCPKVDHQCLIQGTRVVLHSGETVDGVDIASPLGAVVAGKIVDARADSPIPGMVTIFDRDDRYLWSGATREDGTYRTDALPAGTVYATGQTHAWPFACVAYLDRPCPSNGEPISSVAPTPIALQAGEIREAINFSLESESIFRSGFEP